MSSMNPPIIGVKGLKKRYKSTTALNGVDLEVFKGELYGLVGPDGSGKSSLLKAIAGVLSFEGGDLNVFDQNIHSEKSAEKIKSRLGFMAQGLGQNLYRELSVEENIDHFAQLRLVEKRVLSERKKRLLQLTRLQAFKDRPMKKLSGGMKQKLGLVCTLIHNPELIILDEPTTGVDPVSRRDFWWILEQLVAEQKITVLVSSAYMDEAVRFTRTTVLHQGDILAQGTVDEINQSFAGGIVVVKTNALAKAHQKLTPHYPQVEITNNSLRVYFKGQPPEQVCSAIGQRLQGIPVQSIHQAPITLEDTFIALVQTKSTHPPPNIADLSSHISQWHQNHDVASIKTSMIMAKGLVQQFGEFRAVDEVDFEVQRGEIFGLLGANGAGKTTVIKMLTGILTPTAGEGRVAGVEVKKGRKIKQRIGYMSQAFSLYLDLTVMENLRLYGSIYGVPKPILETRIQWILSLMEIEAVTQYQANQLPMGMRQRLALGCALIHYPAVLFLDEPTSGVDPVGRKRFWEILYFLSKEFGVTILITTHYMAEAEHCDHLAIMYAGRVIADDSPVALKRTLELEAGRLLEVSSPKPYALMSELKRRNLTQASLVGNHVHLYEPKEAEEKRQLDKLLLDSNWVEQHRPIPITIDDVFVYLVLALENQESAV